MLKNVKWSLLDKEPLSNSTSPLQNTEFFSYEKWKKFIKMSLVNKVDNTLLARQTEAVRQMLSFNQVTTVSD